MMTNDPLTRLHIAVGELILKWALIDNSLALAVTVIHADLMYYGLSPKPLPKGFLSRLRLLRQWFKEYVHDDWRLERGIEALNTISRTKKFRDNCAHGVVMLDPASPNEVVYVAGNWLSRDLSKFATNQRELSEKLRGRPVALTVIERDVSALDGMAASITFVRGSIQRVLRARHSLIQ